MNLNAFIKVIGAAGSEKVLIECLVQNLGFRNFIENAELIVLNNKTKNAIGCLNNILYGKGDITESISGLTEIPIKILKQDQKSCQNIFEYIIHPEKLDIDARQFYKLRCLKEVLNDFQEEQANQTGYKPEQGYEWEEV